MANASAHPLDRWRRIFIVVCQLIHITHAVGANQYEAKVQMSNAYSELRLVFGRLNSVCAHDIHCFAVLRLFSKNCYEMHYIRVECFCHLATLRHSNDVTKEKVVLCMIWQMRINWQTTVNISSSLVDRASIRINARKRHDFIFCFCFRFARYSFTTRVFCHRRKSNEFDVSRFRHRIHLYAPCDPLIFIRINNNANN